MTDKNKLIIGSFLILFTLIGAGGFGWNWFLNFNDCNNMSNEINRLTDIQGNLLFTYGLFAEKELSDKQKEGLRKYIDLKEPMSKSFIEDFSKKCQSDFQKVKLTYILKGYELYLMTKQGLFNESQSLEFLWIRKNFPFELTYREED